MATSVREWLDFALLQSAAKLGVKLDINLLKTNPFSLRQKITKYFVQSVNKHSLESKNLDGINERKC